MASIGLVLGATVILKMADKRIYVLTCIIPLVYLYITVNVAGIWMVKNVYWNSAAAGYSVLNGILSITMLILGLIIVITALKSWIQLWNSPRFLRQKVAKGT